MHHWLRGDGRPLSGRQTYTEGAEPTNGFPSAADRWWHGCCPHSK